MPIRPDILSWLRRRHERAARVKADADMLVRELGRDAYAEACLMQNRARSAEERRRWRDVALTIARKTGSRVGIGAVTRISMDANLNKRGEPQTPKSKPPPVDQIDELKRLIRGRGPKK